LAMEFITVIGLVLQLKLLDAFDLDICRLRVALLRAKKSLEPGYMAFV
jgi:hypothetical protein